MDFYTKLIKAYAEKHTEQILYWLEDVNEYFLVDSKVEYALRKLLEFLRLEQETTARDTSKDTDIRDMAVWISGGLKDLLKANWELDVCKQTLEPTRQYILSLYRDNLNK